MKLQEQKIVVSEKQESHGVVKMERDYKFTGSEGYVRSLALADALANGTSERQSVGRNVDLAKVVGTSGKIAKTVVVGGLRTARVLGSVTYKAGSLAGRALSFAADVAGDYNLAQKYDVLKGEAERLSEEGSEVTPEMVYMARARKGAEDAYRSFGNLYGEEPEEPEMSREERIRNIVNEIFRGKTSQEDGGESQQNANSAEPRNDCGENSEQSQDGSDVKDVLEIKESQYSVS